MRTWGIVSIAVGIVILVESGGFLLCWISAATSYSEQLPLSLTEFLVCFIPLTLFGLFLLGLGAALCRGSDWLDKHVT